MEYFAGLDISMKETHICVADRDGKVAYEAKGLSDTLPPGCGHRLGRRLSAKL